MNHRPRLWIPEAEGAAENRVAVELPPVRFSGHFRTELIDAKTGEVIQELAFDNILTDQILDAIGTKAGSADQFSNMFAYLAAGTGSVTGVSAPAASNVSLSAEFGPISSQRTNSNGGFADVPATYVSASADGPYWTSKRTRLFTETQANGTITEFGFFNQNSGASIFMANRVAVKDATGSLSSITKTSDNQLRVSFEWRIYPPLADVSSSVTINGATYHYIVRPSSIDISRGWAPGSLAPFNSTFQIGLVSGMSLSAVSGGSTFSIPTPSADSVTLGTYVPGTFQRSLTFTFDPPTANFVSGTDGAYFSPFDTSFDQPSFQLLINPAIKKNNLQRLTLTFLYSWGRK